MPSVFRIASQPARKLPGYLLSSKWSKKLKQTRLPLLMPVTRNNGLMVVCLLFSVMRHTIRPKAGILWSTFLPGKHILLWIKVQMWGEWTVSKQLMWGYLLAQKRHQHLWPRPRLAAMAVLSSGSPGSQSSCHKGIITSQRSIPLSVVRVTGAWLRSRHKKFGHFQKLTLLVRCQTRERWICSFLQGRPVLLRQHSGELASCTMCGLSPENAESCYDPFSSFPCRPILIRIPPAPPTKSLIFVLAIICIIIMFLPQRMRVTCWSLPCVTQASLCREFGQCLLNEPITETLVYAQRNEFKCKPPKRPPGERQKISLTENKTFLRNPHFSFTKETPEHFAQVTCYIQRKCSIYFYYTSFLSVSQRG